MKTRIFLLLIATLLFTNIAISQNRVRIFDPSVIDVTFTKPPHDFPNAVEFASIEVYLNCPTDLESISKLTGPDKSTLIVDNFITLNGQNVCPGEDGLGNCFKSTFTDPMDNVGLPVETAYIGYDEVDISNRIVKSGVYRFGILDYGYTYGNSEVFLDTSCRIVTQVCHRNFGRYEQRTLTVGASAIEAHLGHGDTEGPCETSF